MEQKMPLLTLCVNSCDSYSDIWDLFFQLMERYWPEAQQYPVMLNTETKAYTRSGWDIACVPGEKKEMYGSRMIRHLKRVETPYVLMLLDDFFLRCPADGQKIEQLVREMEENPNIVCFNLCPTGQEEFPSRRYPGFHQLAPDANYKLNMQAALWRTKDLMALWQKDADPWTWELLCNRRTYFTTREFYFLNQGEPLILNYGRRPGLTWGIVRGKWHREDMEPFFEKEGIPVDFSARGWFEPEQLPPPETTNTPVEKIRKLLREMHFAGWQYALSRTAYALAKVLFRLPDHYEVYMRRRYEQRRKGRAGSEQ